MQQTRRENRDERSLGELFSDLARDLGTLVRQELALARTELTDKAAEVGKNVGLLAAGGLVAYAGFLALVAGVIIGLGQLGVEWWISAMVVGVVVAGVGYLLVRRGLDALGRTNLKPERTIETVRDDMHMMKEQTP